ncbi:hypothetical protein HBA56_04140 [Pseudoteredinibacter isoporae]|nr:hypothetical protein [Pseudoteredinibacter isoporae]
MSKKTDPAASGDDLLTAVTESIQVLSATASFGRDDDDERGVGMAFEVDLFDIGQDVPFIGSSLNILGESGEIRTVVASRLIYPTNIDKEGGPTLAEVASTLERRPIAVHNLYDAAASAARTVGASLALEFDIPRNTPPPDVTVIDSATYYADEDGQA